MAGENSIDTGIHTGEAQIFNQYNDQNLYGQAQVGIEQDKIARRAAADAERKKKEDAYKTKASDLKGDGIAPPLSGVFSNDYKDLSSLTTRAALENKIGDFDFENLHNSRVQNARGFISDGKDYAPMYHEIMKMHINGELEPESDKLFSEVLSNPKYWEDLHKKGATLPEISGKFSAELQNIRKAQKPVNWQDFKGLDTLKGIKTQSVSENKETGLKTDKVVFDINRATEQADIVYNSMPPQVQMDLLNTVSKLGQTPTKENALKLLLNQANSSVDTKDSRTYDGNSGNTLGLGNGVTKVNGILAKFNPYETEIISGRRYANINKRDDNQVRTKINEREVLGVVRLEHPDKGLSNKLNEFKDASGNKIAGRVVGLDNSLGKEVIISYKDKRDKLQEKIVPYKGNEVQTTDFLNGSDYDTFFNEALKANGDITEIKKEDDTTNSSDNPLGKYLKK